MSEDKSPKGVQAYAVNRIGHAAGRKLAAGLWKQEWIRRLASQYPELMKIVSEGSIALTSMLEVGGDSTLARLANFVAESLSMENLELLEQFEKDPENKELAAKVEKIGENAGAKAAEDVYLALYHIHKSETCPVLVDYKADATPPAFGGKPGQPPRVNPSTARIRGPMPMADALTATTALCGKCYPALSVRKAEEPQKPKEVVAGRNFLEYVMRLKEEDSPTYERFWRSYLARLDGPDGPDLARKFQEAFNGKHSYEAFRFVAELPSRDEETKCEEWHHALDALCGKVTPADSLKKSVTGFFKDEKKQTEEMFRALFAWIKKGNEARSVRNDELETELAELKKGRKARAAARKRSKLVNRLVFVGLAVIASSIWLFTTTL